MIEEILDNNYNIVFDNVLKIDAFKKCAECDHKSKWHLEGTVFEHIKLVCSKMNQLLLSNNIPDRRKKVLMIAALFHDVGKPLVMREMDNGIRTFIGHEFCSEKITRSLLWDEDYYFREDVCSLVRNHMLPLRLYEDNNKKRKIMLLSHDVNSIEDLILLKKADCLGLITNEKDNWVKKLDNLKEYSKKIDCYNHPYNFFNGYTKFNFFNYDLKSKNPVILTNNKSFDVYIMIGLPGAGKDTYIKNNLPNIPVVSRDDIRLKYYNVKEKTAFNDKREKEVNRIEDEMILNLAKEKKSFIINNINLKRKYRKHYINILNEYKPNIHMIYVQASSFLDNLKRRDGIIKKEVLENMKYVFDFPMADEYVTLKIIV